MARATRKQQQPPKAWQGPNPITQRASNNLPNGTEKPLPKLPSQSQSQQLKSSGDLHADKHAHDRTVFLVSQFIVRIPLSFASYTNTRTMLQRDQVAGQSSLTLNRAKMLPSFSKTASNSPVCSAEPRSSPARCIMLSRWLERRAHHNNSQMAQTIPPPSTLAKAKII